MDCCVKGKLQQSTENVAKIRFPPLCGRSHMSVCQMHSALQIDANIHVDDDFKLQSSSLDANLRH